MVTCIMSLVPRHVRVTSVALYNFFITNLSGLCTLLVPPIRARYDSPHIFSFFAEPLAGAAAAGAATVAAAAATAASSWPWPGGEDGSGGDGGWGGSLPSLPLHGLLGEGMSMAEHDGVGWSGGELGGGADDPVEFRLSAPGSTGLRVALMWIYPGLFLASSCEFFFFKEAEESVSPFVETPFSRVLSPSRSGIVQREQRSGIGGQPRRETENGSSSPVCPPPPTHPPLALYLKNVSFLLFVAPLPCRLYFHCLFVVPKKCPPVFSLAAIVALRRDKRDEEAAAADAAAAAAAAEPEYELLAGGGGGDGENDGDGWLSPTTTRWEARSAAEATARVAARGRGPKRVFGGGVRGGRNGGGGTGSGVGEGAGTEALEVPLLRGSREASDARRSSSPTQP